LGLNSPRAQQSSGQGSQGEKRTTFHKSTPVNRAT
jgi:hypothetical protein